MKRKILLGVLFVLIAIQFIRPEMESNEIDLNTDYIALSKPSDEVSEILKTSCYDCHSNQTEYTWYMQVAPISWWTMDHVNEGKDELNFSNWGTYKAKRQKHKLDECIELIEDNEMPLSSYTIMHSDANLSETQKELLISWFKTEMEEIEIN